MLHRLRHHHQLTALWLLVALLVCVLAGCLQHRLVEVKPPAQAHSHTMHQGHQMGHEHNSPAQSESTSCHSQTDCALEHGQTSSFDWQAPGLAFVLVALLPLVVSCLRLLTTSNLRHNPREGPPKSGYPAPYLTLQVLRN